MFRFVLGFLLGVMVAGAALWQLLPEPEMQILVVHRKARAPAASAVARAEAAPVSTTLAGAVSALRTPDALQEPESTAAAVALPEAHRELLNQPPPSPVQPPPPLAQLHQRFESEDKDPAWAYDAERQLKAYLVRTAPSPRFDVFFVECRKTLCEIQANGYTGTAGDEWDRAIEGMKQQPWWSAFSGNSSSSSAQNGQAVLLTLLQRR